MTNEELVLKIQSGDTSLIPTLWLQVEKFVKQQAEKFYYNHSKQCDAFGVEADDLYQEGYFAICKAVEQYNPDKGVKFLTYAGYHIIKCFYSAAKLNRAAGKHSAISLDAPTNFDGNDGDLTILNILDATSANDEIDNIINREYMRVVLPILNEVLQALSVTQRDTVINCLGFGMSYSEYARYRGVTRATVQHSCDRALKNLRLSPVMAHRV